MKIFSFLCTACVLLAFAMFAVLLFVGCSTGEKSPEVAFDFSVESSPGVPTEDPLIDLGGSVIEPESVVDDVSRSVPQAFNDALCLDITIITYPPECPPCAMLESDGFEQAIAETFGCDVRVDDSGSEPNGIPFARIVMLDGTTVDCRNFYDMSLETKDERLRFVLASIAAAIENHEVKK